MDTVKDIINRDYSYYNNLRWGSLSKFEQNYLLKNAYIENQKSLKFGDKTYIYFSSNLVIPIIWNGIFTGIDLSERFVWVDVY